MAYVSGLKIGFYDIGYSLSQGTVIVFVHVELVYMNQSYQSYIQPAYRITYTQDYWDETDVMSDAPDPESFSSVSVAYVPAVVDEYLEELDVQYMPNT